MIELAIVAMAVAAVVAIAYPLVRPGPGSEAAGGADAGGERGLADGRSDLADLLGQRDALYRAIREIDFEHQLGNLSGDDHRDLRERYKAKAMGTLKAIHDRESTPPLPDGGGAAAHPSAEALEDAVRRNRSRPKAAPARRRCRACDVDYAGSANFCPRCGRPLAPGSGRNKASSAIAR
jgi:hypothetical protein